jgi:hypothetical protein
MTATASDCSALQLAALIRAGKLNAEGIANEQLAAIESCEDRAIANLARTVVKEINDAREVRSDSQVVER